MWLRQLDPVQDTWVRASGAGADDIDNLGWLTTITPRVCLSMLRQRKTRGEGPLATGHLPDPVVSPPGRGQPDAEAVLADSAGLALLIVLEHLFTVVEGRILEVDAIADPDRVSRLAAPVLGGQEAPVEVDGPPASV